MYKVLIADDARITREGLNKIIPWETLDLKCVGLAKDGLEALEIVKQQVPDIVITDINMPGINGLKFLKAAKELYPHIIFIILSAYSEFAYAREAMLFGVKHYVLKPCKDEDMIAVLEQSKSELSSINHNRKSIDLFSKSHSGTYSPKGTALMEQILIYIDNNLNDSTLSLKSIASNVAYITPDYLGRLFREYTGEKFSNYLTNKRIEQAKELIKNNPDFKIYEVCSLSGFGQNTEYFSQVFKKAVSLTPQSYRQLLEETR